MERARPAVRPKAWWRKFSPPAVPLCRASTRWPPSRARPTSYVRPELVSSVVGYLAHEHCQFNGAIVDKGAGRISLQFLSMTEGFVDLELTPESVRDHVSDIVNAAGGTRTFTDAMAFLEWQYQKVVAAGAPPVSTS